MIALLKNRRNASVRGCSSMVEQQLPKLAASAVSRATPSKTRHETALWFQRLPKWAQNTLRVFFGIGAIGIAGNEIRGILMAGPVLATLIREWGTPMAIWIAFCSLAGIALSVVVPVWIYRKVK